MKGIILLLIAGGIFGQDSNPPGQDVVPLTLLTRDVSPSDIAAVPLPDSSEESEEADDPPTRDIPQQKFNFPDDERPHQQQNRPTQQLQQTEHYGIGCTKDHDPLCGSDGKTYNNICEFSQAQRSASSLTVARRGQC